MGKRGWMRFELKVSLGRISYIAQRPGACPINHIPIELEIRPKFAVLWFKMSSANFFCEYI